MKANTWRFGRLMWSNTRSSRSDAIWRKLAKREANRFERRQGKNLKEE